MLSDDEYSSRRILIIFNFLISPFRRWLPHCLFNNNKFENKLNLSANQLHELALQVNNLEIMVGDGLKIAHKAASNIPKMYM